MNMEIVKNPSHFVNSYSSYIFDFTIKEKLHRYFVTFSIYANSILTISFFSYQAVDIFVRSVISQIDRMYLNDNIHQYIVGMYPCR